MNHLCVSMLLIILRTANKGVRKGVGLWLVCGVHMVVFFSFFIVYALPGR